MELVTKLETIVDGFKSQEEVVENLKSEVADLRDAFAGLTVANEPVVEAKKEDEVELMLKSAIEHSNGKKSFNVSQDTSAGALVLAKVADKVLTRLEESNPLIKEFGVETGSVDYTRKVEINKAGAGWVGEATAENGEWARTGAPVYKEIKATSGKAYSKEAITDEALVDTNFNAKERLLNAMTVKLARKFNCTNSDLI